MWAVAAPAPPALLISCGVFTIVVFYRGERVKITDEVQHFTAEDTFYLFLEELCGSVSAFHC